MDFGSDRVVPRLVVEAAADRIVELADRSPSLREVGVEGILVEATATEPDDLEAALRRLVVAAGSIRVTLAGAPRLAAAVGADLLLPASGIAAAEARRQLPAAALLGRELASIAAAGLVVGVDFLVAEGNEQALASGAFRAAIESAPSPVIWRVDDERAARRVVAAGGEGVILPFHQADGAVATARELLAVWPARAVDRRLVVVDGAVVELPPDSAVADVLADLGLRPSRVTRNGVPVPRRTWDERLLEPGDVIETS
jgi:sulfur carrier protein ThiS